MGDARQRGLSLDEHILQIVQQWKSSNGTVATQEPERRREREQAAARIRERRKGNILGPDVTIRDLIEEGRS